MNALDRLFLERAYELARRGIGNTSPNPAVGAVVVKNGLVAGEGHHLFAGEPHAEIHALREAGDAARGATLYVSLEPCNHFGRTPPCTQAVVDAGIERVIIGTLDPNPKTNGGGIRFLKEHGVAVDVADDAQAKAIIEPFARAIRSDRPYVTLKMAMSLDGYVAAQQGRQDWLTGEEARTFVRELRIAHDAVAVGAGTIRIDNPRLTVRPPHHRQREYLRAVFCETDSVDEKSAVFEQLSGYAKTLVLAPSGAREKFANLRNVAGIVFVGSETSGQLDIAQALRELRERGVASLLCEGGPTMAGHLLRLGLVDRFYWLVAPRILRAPSAVPVITGGTLAEVRGIRFDGVERLGADLLISGTIDSNV